MAVIRGTGIFTGLIYSLVALGYTLVYGVLRLINFAHSEVLMSGGFAGYYFLHYTMKITDRVDAASRADSARCDRRERPVGAIVAIGIERFAYRPLRRRNAPKLTYLISAIGASFFLLNFAGKAFGRNPSATAQPITTNFSWKIFGAPITAFDVVLLLVTLDPLPLRRHPRQSKTKIGRSIRAVAQDSRNRESHGRQRELHHCVDLRDRRFHGWRRRSLYCDELDRRLQHGFHSGAARLHRRGPGRHRQHSRCDGRAASLLGLFMYVPIYWINQPFYEPVIGFAILGTRVDDPTHGPLR